MAPRKRTEATLSTDSPTVGEPVPRAIVDTSSGSVGIPRQPEFNAQEISEMRRTIDTLRQQIADAAHRIKGGARHAARQSEATVLLHPVSSLVAVAAIAGAVAFAFAIAGRRALTSRSRYDRTLDDLREFYESVRSRF